MKMPWKPFWAAAALACVPWPAAAHAEDADNLPTGAWSGTVGKAAVMVCLGRYDDSHYYYVRHRQGIRLARPEAAPPATGRFALDEYARGDANRITGQWTLRAQSPSEITGTWAAPGGGKTLPIALRRSAAECEDPAFYAPLLAGMRLSPHRPAVLDGHAYSTLASEEATTVQVPGDSPQARAFNRHALEWLRAQSVLAYECDAGKGFGRRAEPDPLGRTLTPVAWTDQYIVLQDLLPEIYCGGAHGSSSLTYTTWSWPQGRAVDTWAWLEGGEKSLVAHAGKQGRAIPSGLSRLIAQRHPRNEAGDECQEYLDSMSVEPPYPTAQGLVFNTGFPHAIRACNEQVTLEWKRLMPYLSAEGRTLARQWAPRTPNPTPGGGP